MLSNGMPCRWRHHFRLRGVELSDGDQRREVAGRRSALDPHLHMLSVIGRRQTTCCSSHGSSYCGGLERGVGDAQSLPGQVSEIPAIGDLSWA